MFNAPHWKMRRYVETGNHVKWEIDGAHYVGQVMRLEPANFTFSCGFEPQTTVRIQSTGEIVQVETWLLKPNTCREDERNNERNRIAT